MADAPTGADDTTAGSAPAATGIAGAIGAIAAARAALLGAAAVAFCGAARAAARLSCGGGSGGGDCARLGVAWPAANLALAAALASGAAVRLLRPAAVPDRGPITSDRGRISGGRLVLHDNRRRVGAWAWACAAAAAGASAAPFAVARWCHSDVAEHHAVFWLSRLAFWAAALAAVVCDLGAFARARDAAPPLFRWPLLGALAAQAALSVAEALVMLFAPAHAAEPVGASVHAWSAMAAAAASLAALVVPLCAQRRAFWLPREGAAGQAGAAPAAPAIPEAREYHTPLSKERPEDIPLAESPEDAHSVVGQLVFSWVTPVLRLGTRSTIKCADLYHLSPPNRPLAIWRRFAACRRPGMSLLWALWWTFSPQLVAQAALAVLNALLEYSQPFFLQRILRSIRLYAHDPAGAASKRMMCLDAAGLLASSLLHSMSSNRVLWIGRIVSLRVQSLLVAELSSKALQRRSRGTTDGSEDEAKDGSKDGSKDSSKDADDEPDKTAGSDGRVANMLTSDLENLGYISSYLDALYRTPIAFCVGTWYLYSMLGVSALIGLALTAVYYPLTKLMMKYLVRLQRRLCTLDDERVTMVTEVFQGIRAVKLFGWQSRFIAKVRAKRNEEIGAWWRLTLLQLPVMFVRSITTSLILVAVLAIYSLGFGHPLTADIVFPTMTVFTMVSATFNNIPGLFQWMSSCYVSLKRIESFMEKSRLQPLAERVAPGSSPLDVGFEGATFVWSAASSPPEGPAPKLPGQAASSDQRAAHSRASSQASDGTSGMSGQTPLLGTNRASASYGSIAPQRLAGDDDDSSTGGPATPVTPEQFALRDISLRFPAGQLSVVAGPTGAGKSSLLAALIGELTLVQGHVILPTADALDLDGAEHREIIELAGQGTVMTDVAYVAQEAWLRNATIRDNILFGERYDCERYEETLRMCALKPDLRVLAAGDQTEIGERGITLSGGQKQRVALARAVYSSRRILLIDDCLSAVDAHTGKHILHECLASASPLMRGRTRVLVTHHISACLPHCAFVAVLGAGRVVLSGAPADLQRARAGRSLADVLSLEHSPEPPQPEDSSADPCLDEAGDCSSAGVADPKPEDAYNAERQLRRAELGPDAAAAEGLLVDDEEREEGYVRPEVWLQYMRMCGGWWFWATVAGFVVMTRLSNIAQSYWVRIWMSAASAPGGSARGIAFWLAGYSLLEMASSVIYMAAWLVELVGSIRAARAYHERLFERVVNAVPRFFDKTPIGRVISRFSRDMRTIDGTIIGLVVSLGMQLVQVASVFVIISSVVPPFVVIALAMTAAYAMLAIYYLNATRELKRLDSISMSPLLSLFSELITGVESIRAFGAQNQYTKEAMNRVNVHNRPYYLMWGANRWLCTRIEFSGCVVSFSTAVLIILGLDSIDAGLAGFVLMYAMSFSDYMLWFIRNYSDCEISMNSVERVNQYLVLDQEAPAQAPPGAAPPPGWPASGRVEVRDLTVEYVPGAPVLRGVSFSVAHGERIGVVGRTGAGKSTLSLALLRFIEAAQGSIVVDGVDVARIGLEDLRRNVTIIPQDPVLFNGTIRFNLDPFDEYPDALLWDALTRTCLAQPQQPADDGGSSSSVSSSSKAAAADAAGPTMSSVFASLDAEIKENGKNLSLGQRQLVALARALVRRSRLIIMDEATASVDFDTDARIQRTIRGSEFGDSTLFCIAHRLRTVIDYDRVLVLDKGAVVEFDTPHALLRNRDGVFRSMCEKTGELGRLAAAAQASHDAAQAPAATTS
ncbi:hypothetical protein H4R18_001225 [Coemansia javaensis]|uniref:Uncharacterized protein n=1 Tax=Coemansia javaensis TaxID=2761396 RepID=A0A9W8LKK2_9FUNG|nr:hypothetical protein H4R18_001225 [Coemansia javaensis]